MCAASIWREASCAAGIASRGSDRIVLLDSVTKLIALDSAFARRPVP
jgi:hypothetical protein